MYAFYFCPNLIPCILNGSDQDFRLLSAPTFIIPNTWKHTIKHCWFADRVPNAADMAVSEGIA
jgi:hypothetical protein